MPPSRARQDQTALRPRSILLGLLLVPLVSLWVAGMENIYGGRPTYLSIFFHAVILLAALIGVNALLRLLSPRHVLSRAELLVIYVMIGASSGIVGDQFMAILIPSLAYPFRYATDANQWAERLLPYLPLHAVVSDPTAVRNFYEGDVGLYSPENYRPWLLPGLLWASFIAVLQMMCLAINVLIRRQWTQHEKLSFPLTILPLEMTAAGTHSLWRSKLMWLGFALSAIIDIVNGLSMHFPVLPMLKVKVSWLSFSPRWSGALTTTGIAFYPFIIGPDLLHLVLSPLLPLAALRILGSGLPVPLPVDLLGPQLPAGHARAGDRQLYRGGGVQPVGRAQASGRGVERRLARGAGD